MISAIAFSALLALSLTPALCATLLKPVEAGHGHARKGVFGRFNRVLDSGRGGYTRTVKGSLKRTGRLMLVYAALLIGLGWAFVRLPGGFLPSTTRALSPPTCRRRPTPLCPYRGRGRAGRKISTRAPASRTSRS
jgi:multidrug efflux pump subunit AcrB